jgi:AcrR family transcriptional regulator
MQKSSVSATRQQLLDHGLSIASEKGLRGLTVRGLCQHAGINTGSFVYHFGNREQFTTELLEHWYAPLFMQVQLEYDQDIAPIIRLKAMLRQLVGYVSIHGELISQILLDAAAGEVAVVAFMKSLTPRHPRLILQCIVEAQKSKALVRADPTHQMMFIMSTLAVPVLMQHSMGGKEILPDLIRDVLATYAINPHHIEQRLQWALRGLSPPEKTHEP